MVASVAAGTLSGAYAYSETGAFDQLDRRTLRAGSPYTYGDSAHLHAATSIGANYTATYDAAGNMTCRGTSSLAGTCSGSPVTGAQLGYDSEGRLVTWQNLPSAPTSSAQYLYDGEGERVESQVTSAGVTTTTVFVGSLEEVASSPTGTTTTSYAYAPDGERIALSVNGTLSYQAVDHLGSAAVTLDGSGNLTGSQLYAAYGTSAYASGTMPGSYGYTGQHSDVATTGLDYYGARSYDPTAGQFTSADTLRDGQSRFGYVGGNPETYTDPSGHECMAGPYDCGGEPIAGREGSGGGGWGSDPQDPSAGPGPSDPGSGGNTGGNTSPSNGGNDGNNSGPNTGGGGGNQGGPTNPGDPNGGTSGGNTTGSSGTSGSGASGGGNTDGGTGGSGTGSPTLPPTVTSPPQPPITQPTLPGLEPPVTYIQPTLPGMEPTESPVLGVDANEMPNIAQNIQEAQDEGAPRLLNRETDQARIRANRRAACADFEGDGSCDEYPFASTKQGGANGRVWTRAVPLQEQRIQGARLQNFYARYGIGDGDAFLVRVINLPH